MSKTDVKTAKFSASAEMILALVLTCIIAALHFYFYRHAGGLWRDEVNSINIGRGNWQAMMHDSFPLLFPLMIRVYGGVVGSDWRVLGLLFGLSLTAAWWSAMWKVRRMPPLWSLVLMGLNSWIIIYASSLRAYGLGSAGIVLCFGAAWSFLERPNLLRWFCYGLAATLSVQVLYHNAALVAAICVGAMTVAAIRNQRRAMAGIVLGGLMAASTLLPYWHSITGITRSTYLKRDFFDATTALTNVQSILAFPLPQFFWIWVGLVLWVCYRGIREACKEAGDERILFGAVTLVCGLFAYTLFLRKANFYVQPWYFLPLLALVGIIFDSVMPRLEGKYRSVLWGSALAVALVSANDSLQLLNWRLTNIDLLAAKISREADRDDYVIVKNWTYGITFNHYFKGPCGWSTVPPISDHQTARMDLYDDQTRNPNAMSLLLEQLSHTLQSGHKVWIVGRFNGWDQSYDAKRSVSIGWDEMVGGQFNQNVNDFLRRHCKKIQCLNPGTSQNVNFNEQAALFQGQGWQDPQ